MSKTVFVIGGGPAGMAAALFAARAGAHAVLMEKNEKLGKKLYITGKGRCNVTSAAENLMNHIPRNPRFLYSAFACFSPDDLRDLLAQYGCPTKEERGERVFPVSEKASDVTRALERALREAGVEIRLNAQAASLEPLLRQGAVVVATGGLSYPSTGSTGDGYRFAQQAGHSLIAPKPSLIPLETREQWPKALQGLSLKNVTLRAEVNGKKRYEEQGEMLFTHFGISGPLTLSMSSHIADDPPQAVRVTLDMKPALTVEQLEARLQREFDASPKKRIASILPALLPARMADVFPALCAVNGETLCAQVSRADRRKIAETLKKIPLTIRGPRPVEEAIVTRGGVPVNEVSPRDMMSKKRPGLFFAGEVLDVDAHTGGFNLQIAFSTGVLAGKSAAAWEENVE